MEVQQIGKTADESSYMIGRFNTDTDTDVTVQLFGQEIMNLRKRDGVPKIARSLSRKLSEHGSNKSTSGASDSGDGGVHSESKSVEKNVLSPKVRQNSGLRLKLPLVHSTVESADNSNVGKESEHIKERSPTSVKDVKEKLLASSKSILGKVLSPTKEKLAKEKV